LPPVIRSADSVSLEQAVLECDSDGPFGRETGGCEEVLFVVAGSGSLTLGGQRHELEPECGAYIPPGENYELHCAGTEPLRIVSVRVTDPDVAAGAVATERRAAIRPLAEQEAHSATGAREFRIVADPATGLSSATHFVGYIPPGRAPDHFHTYDEVIYVLDGEGVFHTAGSRQALSRGSQIELSARTVHCLENTGERVMRVVAVFRPAGSPAAAYYPDGTPAHADAPALQTAGS
jgi:mannose-6-phosphate isomerase-like protein (cupin superfamily)